MRPIRIIGATRVLAKDQKEYVQLPIRDSFVTMSSGVALPFMTSAWEPSPSEAAAIGRGAVIAVQIMFQNGLGFARFNLQDEERAVVAAGGSFLLSITGSVHPPVMLAVEKPDASVGRAPLMVGPYAVVIGVQTAPALEDAI